MADAASHSRLALAEEFLQEAVYRSRGDQAGATLLSAGSASCGLGEKPSVRLDLSPKAEQLFGRLFESGGVNLDGLEGAMAAWVRRQDALDRKRNHFLKDFRATHGSDRRAYAPEILAAYEQGLDEVNGEVSEARRHAAQGLLDAAAGGHP